MAINNIFNCLPAQVCNFNLMKIDRIIKLIYKLTDDRPETKLCIINMFFNLQKQIFDKYCIYFYVFIVLSYFPQSFDLHKIEYLHFGQCLQD